METKLGSLQAKLLGVGVLDILCAVIFDIPILAFCSLAFLFGCILGFGAGMEEGVAKERKEIIDKEMGHLVK